MKALTLLVLTGATLLLAACEHTPPKLIYPPSYGAQQVANAEAAGTPDVVCTREIPTGLRMAVTRCRAVAEVDRQRDADRSWAEKIPAELPRER